MQLLNPMGINNLSNNYLLGIPNVGNRKCIHVGDEWAVYFQVELNGTITSYHDNKKLSK